MHIALLLKLERPRIYLSLVIPARKKLKATARKLQVHMRWRTLLGKSDKWKAAVDDVMEESKKVEAGIRNDEDLNRVREAHAKLGSDIEQNLVEAGQEAQTGMQVAVENKTEPSTRMTRSNSSSRTSASLPLVSFLLMSIFAISLTWIFEPLPLLGTSIGVSTHIRIQALQLALKDVSFWYKDKAATAIGPREPTGPLGLELPAKGIDVDLKVRLISQVQRTQFAMGAEPQILSGEKQGLLGTRSEPIKDKLQRVGEEMRVTTLGQSVNQRAAEKEEY